MTPPAPELPPFASDYTWTMRPVHVPGMDVPEHVFDGRKLVPASLIEPDPWGYIDHFVLRSAAGPISNMDALHPFRFWIACESNLLVFAVVRDVLAVVAP